MVATQSNFEGRQGGDKPGPYINVNVPARWAFFRDVSWLSLQPSAFAPSDSLSDRAAARNPKAGPGIYDRSPKCGAPSHAADQNRRLLSDRSR
ncbi:MAG TPA: hypothetical protein VGB99_03140, partial [Acidobacteriota bacterium]